jgi:hypothetical protein
MVKRNAEIIRYSIFGAVFVMSDEGKTVDRLITTRN